MKSAITQVTGLVDALAGKEPVLPTFTEPSPETHYLNANKVWTEIAIGSGGYASNVYLTDITSTTNANYKKLSYTNDVAQTTKSIVVNNNELLIEEYILDIDYGLTTIDAGVWLTNMYCLVSSATGITQIRGEVFKRTSAGVETVLFSHYSDEINNTTVALLRIQPPVQPSFTVNTTDRIGIKFYAKTTRTTNTTVTYYVGDGYSTFINTPTALRHSQLRDKNGEAEYQHMSSSEKTNLNNQSNTNTGDETAARIGAITNGADAITTLADTDLFGITISSVLEKITWDSFKTILGSIFAKLNGGNTFSGMQTVSATDNSKVTLTTTNDTNGTITEYILGANPSVSAGVILRSTRTSGLGSNTKFSIFTTKSGVQNNVFELSEDGVQKNLALAGTGTRPVVVLGTGELGISTGATGTFTTVDSKTVTVTNGIITSIV